MTAHNGIKNVCVYTGMVVIAVLSLLVTQLSFADEIRRIVRPDGVVEYTNVPEGKAMKYPSTRAESIFKYRQSNGTLTFSDQRPAKGVEYETLKFACFACNPRSSVNWHATPLNLTDYVDDVLAQAKQFGVDPALVRAVIHAESAFNPKATSSQGAKGLMQLMPFTAEEMGVANVLNARENIAGGVRYLAQMLTRFNGDTRLATAAYNAGPGAVSRYEGVPPYAETQAYVKRVAILHQRYRNANKY